MDFDHDIDKENMGVILSKFSQQCWEAMDIAKDIKINIPIKNILAAGMGGSGIAADILQTYLGAKIPVYVNKDFSIPEFINSETLVFCISYSGNTEETIATFRAAVRQSAQIVVITSGGKLEELANKLNRKVIKIPKNIPPRTALGYLFLPMLNVLQNSKIISDRTEEIQGMVNSLKNVKFKEKAQDLAVKLKYKIPLIYSSEKLKAVALRWKTQFNENAKVHAFTNVFPELDHNEIEGYSNLNEDYFVIMLVDENDKMIIKNRMDAVKKIIVEKTSVREIKISGDNRLTKIFSAIYLGDLTSYYLALLYNIDPSPVDLISRLKGK